MQKRLAAAVERHDRLGPVRHVGGVDVAYRRDGAALCAAAAVLRVADLRCVDAQTVAQPVTFPYRTGLLSFREAPAAIAAVRRLRVPPDLLLCDGQGIAHPRRCGLASHLGVLLDLPSIGVGKSRLVGSYREPPAERGAWSPLIDRGEVIGAVLRTRTGVRPLFVSIGHRVSLATAIEWVLRCTPRYRLPVTTRTADRLARAQCQDAGEK